MSWSVDGLFDVPHSSFLHVWLNVNAHLLSDGPLHDRGHHIHVVDFGLDAEQLVARVRWVEASAVFQRLLPGLVLLHQDQIVPQADEGKQGGAVLGGHLFLMREDGDTVAVVPWLAWCPV